MSYLLYRVHWKKYRNHALVRELYSFHYHQGDIACFIKKVMEKQMKRGTFHYTTEGPGNLHKANGKLYEKVKKSQCGVWSKNPH